MYEETFKVLKNIRDKCVTLTKKNFIYMGPSVTRIISIYFV